MIPRAARRALEADNRRWPVHLVRMPRDEWPPSSLPVDREPLEAWRSRDFLVQVYPGPDGIERLSVSRTHLDGTGWQWKADITWDDLQRLKSECGRGAKDALELYPGDRDVVNVANMRHLWVMPGPVAFAWRTRRAARG